MIFISRLYNRKGVFINVGYRTGGFVRPDNWTCGFVRYYTNNDWGYGACASIWTVYITLATLNWCVSKCLCQQAIKDPNINS